MKCSIVGCERKATRKGMCNKHYQHEYLKNHPELVARKLEVLKASYPERCLTLKSKFNRMLDNARRKGFEVLVTFEEFSALRVQPCHYCGKELPKTGSGIDRKDSSLGYIAANIVPCCWNCNDTKGDKLSYEEMLNLVAFRQEVYVAEKMIGAC